MKSNKEIKRQLIQVDITKIFDIPELKKAIQLGFQEGKAEARAEVEKDLRLAKQCLNFTNHYCATRGCKNLFCPLNENPKLKGEKKQ